MGEALIGLNYVFLRNVQADESESEAQVICECDRNRWYQPDY